MAFRANAETIYFISGTDSSYSLFSKKTFKLDIPSKTVSRVDSIDIGRYNFAINSQGVSTPSFSLEELTLLGISLYDWRNH